MARLSSIILLSLFVLPLASVPQQPSIQPGRALAIEDYYRIQSVGNPQISPDGKWIVFTVSTRIEEDNGTRMETCLVPTDASLNPHRVLHYGKDVVEAGWTGDNRLQYTADRQRWTTDPLNSSATPVRTVRLPSGAAPVPIGN